ncbi:MAG TPA: flagellar hook-associated protein FlgL [Armatimonadota bacterium]|nr:flagellar hook-associated protein FlgL [Armatimonadota bacterium]
MRITNNTLTNNLRRNLSSNLERLAILQEHISTSKRILKPSDDPIGIARALSLSRAISVAEQYQYNSEDTVAFLEQTETSLASLGDTLESARERIVEAANDTLSQVDRQAIAAEVDAYIDQVISAANAQEGSRSIFAGYQTTDPAVTVVRDSSGRVIDVVYDGDDGLLLREIASGEVVAANLTGREVFFGQTHQVTSLDGVGAGNERAVLDTLGLGITDSRFTINGASFTVSTVAQSLEDVARLINDSAVANVRATISDTGQLILTSNSATQTMEIQSVSGNFLNVMGVLGGWPATGSIGSATTADALSAVTSTYGTATAGRITFDTDAAGLVVAGTVAWTADPRWGAALTTGQQAQLTALNAGGMALQPDSLSAFGLSLTVNGAPSTAGTTEIVLAGSQIVGTQVEPRNVFATLIHLRDDLLVADEAYFAPTPTITGTTDVVRAVQVSPDGTDGTYIRGSLSIQVDSQGRTVAGGVRFSPLYDGLPLDEDQQAQLDALNAGGVTLASDSLSALGLTLTLQIPPATAGTAVIEIAPVERNMRTQNLNEVGLTAKVSGGGIVAAWGTPLDGRSGSHRLTVSHVALGAATVGGAANVVTGVRNDADQNAGVFRFTTDANGVVLAGSVVFEPAAVGGRAPTAAQQAQLDALNAGGVAVTADALSTFGIRLTTSGGGPPYTPGATIITIAPTTATVTDEFYPADGTGVVTTSDTIMANALNELSNSVRGATVVTGDLIEGGSAIITSTSRVRELDLNLDVQLRQHADVGARYNRVGANIENLSTNKLNFQSLLSKVEGLDMSAAAVEYQALDNVYEACLSVGSRVILTTLLDYLR